MAKARWIKTADFPGRNTRKVFCGIRKSWTQEKTNKAVDIWAWAGKYEVCRSRKNGQLGMMVDSKFNTLAEAENRARQIMKTLF